MVLINIISLSSFSQVIEEKHSETIYSARAATISYFEFSSDGKYLAVSGGNYGRLYTWPDRIEYMVLKHHAGKTDNVYLTKFSPDNNFVATIGFDGGINVWDIDTKKESKDLSLHKSWLHTETFLSETYKLNKSNSIFNEYFLQPFAVNQVKRITASSLENNNNKPFDVDVRFKDENGRLLQTLVFDLKTVYTTVTNSRYGYVFTPQNKLENTNRFHPAMIFSPDGKWFLIGNTKGKVFIYKVLN